MIRVAQLLSELGQQPVLERFRLEYETLYRALKKSHESEKRLVKKCRELTADIGSTQNKTASAIKLSANDQNDIAALKNDILRISTSVESSLIKEKETKEELTALKEEIEGLRVEVKQGASGSVQQEAKLRDLTAMRDDLMRERDATAHQVMQVRSDSTDLAERLKVVEADKMTLDAAVMELKREIDGKKNETERERRRKEKEEVRLKELKVTLEKCTAGGSAAVQDDAKVGLAHPASQERHGLRPDWVAPLAGAVERVWEERQGLLPQAFLNLGSRHERYMELLWRMGRAR